MDVLVYTPQEFEQKEKRPFAKKAFQRAGFCIGLSPEKKVCVGSCRPGGIWKMPDTALRKRFKLARFLFQQAAEKVVNAGALRALLSLDREEISVIIKLPRNR